MRPTVHQAKLGPIQNVTCVFGGAHLMILSSRGGRKKACNTESDSSVIKEAAGRSKYLDSTATAHNPRRTPCGEQWREFPFPQK
ncbi:hypothetical protein CDAR_109261 [Caerostris darwini]|uniref:Uncharacterized protein n=1 Tax=Caerostris darwini TaxID=1538125 RepID=A0AAV4TUD3_9ARAC|nr:hypothetical protein CDAR_109261 [Caerostris darwini]